jgi:hypothetical protein
MFRKTYDPIWSDPTVSQKQLHALLGARLGCTFPGRAAIRAPFLRLQGRHNN